MAQAKTAASGKAKLSKKELREQAQARGRLYSRLTWSAIGLAALAALGYGGWQIFRPKPGVNVAQMARTHIQVGDEHEPYNSDPPTSGPHASAVEAGFYTAPVADENLVHNLEHGYVVIWYNCSGLESSACDDLQQRIQGVMDRAGSAGALGGPSKLVAVPRPTMDVQVAATTWGRILKQPTLDERELLAFIKDCRNKAPEGAAS